MSRFVRKPIFCICENIGADQLSGDRAAPLFSPGGYFINPKFQASKHLLWLYSPVCVEHDRIKIQRHVFS